MRTRPPSITVVAWFLIVMGVISLAITSLMLNNPQVLELMRKNLLPIPVQYAMTYTGLAVILVSGVAMLKGHNWGRMLYVIWTSIGFVIGVAASPAKASMIPGLAVFLVIVYFLFRPSANAYFSPAEPGGNP